MGQKTFIFLSLWIGATLLAAQPDDHKTPGAGQTGAVTVPTVTLTAMDYDFGNGLGNVDKCVTWMKQQHAIVERAGAARYIPNDKENDQGADGYYYRCSIDPYTPLRMRKVVNQGPQPTISIYAKDKQACYQYAILENARHAQERDDKFFREGGALTLHSTGWVFQQFRYWGNPDGSVTINSIFMQKP